MYMMPADDWFLQAKALPRGFGCHLVPADKSAHLRFWLSVDACKQKHSPKVLVVTWCQCTKAPARGVYTPKEWSVGVAVAFLYVDDAVLLFAFPPKQQLKMSFFGNATSDN